MAAEEESTKQSSISVGAEKPIVTGRIKFPFTSDEEAKYVKFYYSSEISDAVDDVLKTVVDDLHIDQRDTLRVITISGGDENTLMKKKREEFLIDEFKELIQNDEPTLIITSGVDSGVVHVIGETLKKIPAWTANDGHVCLGILEDDYKMRDLLEKDGEENEMLEVNIRALSDNKEKNALLPNRHHTHLLVVQPKKEREVRRQLEHYITTKAHAVRGWSVVMLSVGGALVTIGEVANAVSDEKPIPVVLFGGTGGATDLIINLINKDIRKEKIEEFISSDSELQKLLERHMAKEPKHLQESTGCRANIREYAKKILEGKKQLNIYKPTKKRRKENGSRRPNSLDDVVEEVAAKMKGCGSPLVIQAFRNQKITDIPGLLDGKYNISVDLDTGTISVTDKKKVESKERFDVDRQLLMAIRKYLKQKSSSIDQNVKTDDKAGYIKSPDQQLICGIFLLAITTSRFKLADYTWSKLEDPIIASLAVSCALKSVAEKLPQREQKKHDIYTELSRKYERKAIALIEIAYKQDAEKAGVVLQERHVAWRKYNCLEVAIRGKAKDFLSQDCCHYKLRKMWLGAIDIKEKHWKILILSPIYWFFAGCVPVKFEEKPGKVRDNESEETSWSYFEKCPAFYRAPVAKYGCHVATFIVFLLLYAYLMVFGNFDSTFSAIDIILHIWIVTLFIETIREMFHLYKRGPNFTRWKHFKLWSKKLWNQLSLATIICVIIAFTCRWFTVSRQAARFFYAVSYSLFTLRILRLYTASKVLGPMVSMIKLMFTTTVKFSAIFFVFLSAYAVAVQAVIGGHAGEKVTFYALLDIFYEPYFQTFGEFFLDDIPGADEEMDGDAPRTVTSTMYIIFLGFYLFVGHLLMMNLLIAIFNRDIEKVNEKSKEIWTYEHYILHEQFSEKPVLPEPFSLLAYFYYLVRFIIRQCCSNDEQSDGNTMACTEFVQKCMSQYKEEEKQSPDHSHEQMISQLKQICDDIRKRKLTVNTVYINATKIKHNTNAIDEEISREDSLGKRMEAFEKRVMEKLDELVGAKDKK